MKKILVIEDDLDTLDILDYLIQDMNCEVSRSQQLIPVDDVISINPDIILVDYWLPNGHGSDFCTAIKQHPTLSSIPVVLISTHVKLKTVAEQSCADGYLEKPFNIGDLEQIIAKVSSPVALQMSATRGNRAG